MKFKQTPETGLKRSCTQMIKHFGGYSLPIPGGVMGIPGAPDRIVFYRGTAYAVEFKAPGKQLGPKQEEVKARIEATGCQYLIVRHPKDLVTALNLPVLEVW